MRSPNIPSGPERGHALALVPLIWHHRNVHPFPPSSELQFLVGKEIGQIALDPWSLQFRFADGGRITVESKIEHIDEEGVPHRYDCQERTGSPLYLHRLLQQPIAAVMAEPLCLTLTLGSGALLRIYSDDGPYECGQIFRSDAQDDLIVF